MEIWNLCKSYSIISKRQALKMLKDYSEIRILRLEYIGVRLVNFTELDYSPKKTIKDASGDLYFTYDLGSTSIIIREYDDMFLEIRMNK